MATFTPSPLLSSIGGRAGNVEFARRGGLHVLRSDPVRVDPRTPAQLTHRDHVRKAIAWWNDTKSTFASPIKQLLYGRPLTAYNLFLRQNVADLAAGVPARIMPTTTPTDPVNNLDAGPGFASGSLKLTWTIGSAYGGHRLLACTEPTSTPPDQSGLVPTALFMLPYVYNQQGVVTGLAPDREYHIWLIVDPQDGTPYSIARYTTGTTKA